VRIHGRRRRHDDARRLDDVDGVDADARSFRGDEFAVLAKAIAGCVAAYPKGLADQVLFAKRPVP
jgi:hypothetical protein